MLLSRYIAIATRYGTEDADHAARFLALDRPIGAISLPVARLSGFLAGCRGRRRRRSLGQRTAGWSSRWPSRSDGAGHAPLFDSRLAEGRPQARLHGYEIIKRVEEKTDGGYAPSPGTVYPTLQLLEDMGQVRSESQQERRVYHLTDAGRVELESKADEVEAVWSRFGGRIHVDFDLQELGFLRSEVGELLKTTFQVAFRGPLRTADPATMREVRLALERCKNEIREIGGRAGRGDRPADSAQPSGDQAQGAPMGPSGTTERF
jgi:DNA-binding PadR family transcriptional regulator